MAADVAETLRKGEMPKTEILFYGKDDGSVPILDWLDALPGKAQVKCLVRMSRSSLMG